jgi:phage-related protein
MKELHWIGSTKERLKCFPEQARREGGQQLRRVQRGLYPKDWKIMPAVGSGVIEIRIHEPHEHRIFYLAGFLEAVYVLHAFEKKTQKTRQYDINMGRKNYGYVKEKRK